MAKREYHNQECLEILGETFDYVHAWLDELSFPDKPNMLNINHRRFRHHKEGIEEVRKKWGDIAAMAAELHILMDEGVINSKAYMEMMYDEKPKFIDIRKL